MSDFPHDQDGIDCTLRTKAQALRLEPIRTAPLISDPQIELMVNAAERHGALAAPWMADDRILALKTEARHD